MALPSFLPFFVSTPSRFYPSSSFIRHFLYRSRVTFFLFSSFFHLFLFFFSFLRFFSRSSSFINRLLSWLFTVEYIALFFVSSQFLCFYRPPPSLDVPFTEPLWSSALFPFLFSPPLITPEMIFFCAPLYIYAPFAIFLTSVLLSLSLWQKSLIYLISFYVSCIHFLVFDYAFYNLLKIFNFFKIKFF